MARDYNVDDILEELRTRKEGDRPRYSQDTYDYENTRSRESSYQAPPQRGYGEEGYSPRRPAEYEQRRSASHPQSYASRQEEDGRFSRNVEGFGQRQPGSRPQRPSQRRLPRLEEDAPFGKSNERGLRGSNPYEGTTRRRRQEEYGDFSEYGRTAPRRTVREPEYPPRRYDEEPSRVLRQEGYAPRREPSYEQQDAYHPQQRPVRRTAFDRDDWQEGNSGRYGTNPMRPDGFGEEASPSSRRLREEENYRRPENYAARSAAPDQSETLEQTMQRVRRDTAAGTEERFQFGNVPVQEDVPRKPFDFDTAPMEPLPSRQEAPVQEYPRGRADFLDQSAAADSRSFLGNDYRPQEQDVQRYSPREREFQDLASFTQEQEPHAGAQTDFPYETAQTPAHTPSWQEETPFSPVSEPPAQEDGFRFDFGTPPGEEESGFSLKEDFLSEGFQDQSTRMDIPIGAPQEFETPRVSQDDYTQVIRQEEYPSEQFSRREERARRGEAPAELARSQWQASYAQQEFLETEPLAEDDFTAPEDAPYVEKEIKSIKTGLTVKLVISGILAFVLIYLAFSINPLPFTESVMLPLPKPIFPEENMRLFIAANLLITVISAIVCSNVIGGGIVSLCKMKADSDSPVALAMLGVLIQGIMLVLKPEMMDPSVVCIYFSVAGTALFFNLVGKKMLINRVQRNFHFLTGEREKYAFLQVKNREFAREFTRGLGADVDRVAFSTKTDFITGFLDKSYSPDYSEGISRLVVPISFVGSIVVAAVTYILTKDIFSAITGFTAILCICAPFSCAIIPNLMQAKVTKKLTRMGAMLAGYSTAQELADTDAVVVSDKELFVSGSVLLHGMKVFAEKRIDEAILDAASVIISCQGIMTDVFLNMVGNNRRLLKKVDSVVYEDGLGISAWVDGKRVLIGSSQLMRHHGIECPSRDFESRYVRDGRQVLYLANSGELSAMFVVSYNADPDVAQAVSSIADRGLSLIVYSTDPNITSEHIAAVFDIPRDRVKVLPAKMHSEYKTLTAPKEKVSAGSAHSGALEGIPALIKGAQAVKRSVTIGTITQLIGIMAGYGLVAFMSFANSLSSIQFTTMLMFQLGWLVLVSLICSLGKK